jgi:hypothetical protein
MISVGSDIQPYSGGVHNVELCRVLISQVLAPVTD